MCMKYLHSRDLRQSLSTTGSYVRLLEAMGIKTLEDFLLYYPRAHEDRSQLASIENIEVGKVHTFMGELRDVENTKTRNNKILTKALFIDSSGNEYEAVWFNQRYLKNTLITNKQILLTGKVQFQYGKFSIQSPQYEPIRAEQVHTGRIISIYREHDKISSKWIREKMKGVMHEVQYIEENLPSELIEKEQLIGRKEAIRKIHFPQSQEDIDQARERLAFEELYFIQKQALEQKKEWQYAEGFEKSITLDVEFIKIFLDSLPFSLTQAQKIALFEILQDMEKDYPMMRLLEGDVGSGKTVVVAAAMMNVFRAGWCSMLMAPTEVLARQHYSTLQKLTDSFVKHPSYSEVMKHEADVAVEAVDLFSNFMNTREPKIALLTGSVKGKQRQEVLLALQSGAVDIVVGTHALIQESVDIDRLGFAVVDEQHKFGVMQRQRIKDYGNPHILNMSATPIPRSLALTAYGDQDLSVINEMPPGRQEIETKIVPPAHRDQVNYFINKQVEEGRQVYVICPLIDESDTLEVKSAIQEKEFLQTEVFPHLRIGLLHGKLSPQEKTTIMQQFKDHQLDVLVSTSVIEVGVDVPNATIMLIEGSERFGLAQLHQFRGRVGRGSHKSYCYLFTNSDSHQSSDRLRAMELYKDGFRLAEIDMKIRGPGEVYGVRQSGLPDLKMASLGDSQMVARVRKAAEEYLKESIDPSVRQSVVEL